MMTGVTSDVSGVYGNLIFGGEGFRYANPDDVRVPTLPARARAAGLDTAVIGFGMIRPEDATIFRPPWWINEFIQRARDAEPTASDRAWLRAYLHQDGDNRLERAAYAARYPLKWPELPVSTRAERLLYGLMADHHALEWTGLLAASENAPDLIVTEYLTTDSAQHYTGYKSEISHWVTALADQLVGSVLARLNAAGVADRWNLAVMSDHGHSAIETAIHPRVIIPGTTYQSEGSVLHVAPRDADHLAQITAALAEYGAQPLSNHYIPADHRDRVYAFVAPDKFSFEDEDPDEKNPTGAPKLISSHGLLPGSPGDDRFALFAGPNVPTSEIASADAVQIAPTLATILGLPLGDFPAQPVFQPTTAPA
jgi:predicted AlkP superfamily pyrophosphatase or phosphodiesterase